MCEDDEKAMELDPLADRGTRTGSDKRGRSEDVQGRRLTVGQHVQEYCSCTSIHGVQYLVGRPRSEMMLWIIVFIISFLGNSYLVSKIWIKWNQSPVIVTFAERASPVWEIPFPAITICPMTRYRASEFDMRTAAEEFLETGNEENVPQWVKDISLICDDSINVEVDNTTTEEIYTNFREKGVDMNASLLAYEWKSLLRFDTESKFTETVTSDGFCLTFNGLNRSEIFRDESIVEGYLRNYNSGGWTPEGGYVSHPDTDDTDVYPFRVEDAGMSDGLTFALRDNPLDFDYWCNGFTPAFKIHLHNPASVPNVNKKYFLLESGYRGIVGVVPDIVKTSETLISYTPEMRQCYFSHERHLKHFKIYTQSNCELECRTNYTLKICGCAAFYMPRSNSSVPICGGAMKTCVEDVKAKMRRKERNLGINGCHCLPSCTTMMFKLDVTQNKLDWTKSPVMQQYNLTGEIEKETSFTSVVIYFADTHFIASERSELYGLADFLANCGGLIGLFSGFSVLSIVEVVYFLTLRGYNNLFWRSS